jgi:hypothetical protein
MMSLRVLAGVAAVFVAASAHATEITFEDQPAGTGGFSTAGPTDTLVYNIGGGQTATFSGGVILTDESGTTTDASNVYATASSSVISGADPSLLNPLTIAFSQPVQDFQLEVINALAGNYELSDNAGHTDSFSIAVTGTTVETAMLANAGTLVHLTYLDPATGNPDTAWDFAIDDVSFDTGSTTTVPEPATWTMLILGLAMVGFAARRGKIRTRTAA